MAKPPRLDPITVQQAVDRYLDLARVQIEVGQLQPTTVQTYARDLHEFVRLAGAEATLDDLEGTDIDRIVLAYGREPDHRHTRSIKTGRGRGIATQARFRQSLSRFFRHATTHGWVQANPMDTATVKPRLRGEQLRPARKALPLPQATALLTHGPANDDEHHPNGRRRRTDQRLAQRDRALLWLLATVGPRVSEVCGANRGDLYREDGITYWRILGKGGKLRRVPIPELVAAQITTYHETDQLPATNDSEQPLFRTFTGRRITPRDVQNLLRRAVWRVPADQRRDTTPHALRHTAATILISQGEDPSVVQRLLGHADLSTTGRYRDELPGELERLMGDHPMTR